MWSQAAEQGCACSAHVAGSGDRQPGVRIICISQPQGPQMAKAKFFQRRESWHALIGGGQLVPSIDAPFPQKPGGIIIPGKILLQRQRQAIPGMEVHRGSFLGANNQAGRRSARSALQQAKKTAP